MSTLSILRSALRNWLFQVSKDAKNWTTLYTHTDDNSLNEPGYVYENLCPLFSSELKKKYERNTLMRSLTNKSTSHVTVRRVGNDPNLIFTLLSPTRRFIPRLPTCLLGNLIYYCYSKEIELDCFHVFNRSRISSVVRALDCRAGGRGFDSRDGTNTQGLKMTDKWRYCLCCADG